MIQRQLAKLMPELEGSIMPEAKFMQDNYLLAVSRYELASKYAKNKVVLEVGCGAGYGAEILSWKAKKVYAIDNNKNAIRDCKKNYQQNNLVFKLGDMIKLDFPSNHFDLITAFEVLEHIEDYQKAISEFLRVLKPGGIIILSTPNKEIYSPGTKKPFYPYHFQEFTLDNLKNALSSFKNLDVRGQYIKGKKLLLYRKWDPRRILRIIYANLPFFIKKTIINLYLIFISWAYELKIYQPKKIKKSDIYFSKNLAKTRIFICLGQKSKI